MSNLTNELPKLMVHPDKKIKFYGPFSRPSKATIKLTNQSETQILFKIKTNAPYRYFAKPNSGVVAPQSSLVIKVSLQPISEDILFFSRDKFLLESAVASLGYDGNFRNAWNEVEKSKIVSFKLKCSPRMTQSPSCLFGEETLNGKSDSLHAEAINEEESRADGLELNNRDKIKAELEALRVERSNLLAENQSLKADIIAYNLSKEQSESSMPKNSKLVSVVSCLSLSILFAICAITVFSMAGDLLGSFKEN